PGTSDCGGFRRGQPRAAPPSRPGPATAGAEPTTGPDPPRRSKSRSGSGTPRTETSTWSTAPPERSGPSAPDWLAGEGPRVRRDRPERKRTCRDGGELAWMAGILAARVGLAASWSGKRLD